MFSTGTWGPVVKDAAKSSDLLGSVGFSARTGPLVLPSYHGTHSAG
jgi:hypothetical protein